MTGQQIYCSFCGKSKDEVQQLIAGPGNFICDECVEMCMGIVLEHRAKTRTTKLETVSASPVPGIKREVNREIDAMIAKLNNARQ